MSSVEVPATGRSDATGIDDPDDLGEQMLLPGMPARAKSKGAGSQGRGTAPDKHAAPAIGAAGLTPATHLPVARVSIDGVPAHLDRPFDYLVPEPMSAGAQPGTRVKARFAGRDVDGIILERVETSEHEGKLTALRRLVSPEVVLSPTIARLAREVADYYGGSLADVLRLAIPPRHARTEAAPTPTDVASADTAAPDSAASGAPGSDSAAPETAASDTAASDVAATIGAPVGGGSPAVVSLLELAESEISAWTPYIGGAAFARRVHAGDAPRAVWTALPGTWHAGELLATGGWENSLAQVVMAATGSGRGALVVLPDARDVNRLSLALEAQGLRPYGLKGGDFARLLADDGAAQRYRSYLAVLRGEVRIVIGTRAAAFAPVHDLGLAVCWEDGETTHQEPRAPYPHVREILALRSSLEQCAYLVGSVSRSAQSQAMLASGWAREITADRSHVRAHTPRVRVLDSVELASEGAAAAARIPAPAWRLLNEALKHGPVLVQVARRGYIPVIACQRCREAARCSHCHGPLGLAAASGEPQCTWCGQLAGDWSCSECGGKQIRSVRVGSERTAEELGRAFPGIPVKVSGASSSGGVLDQVTGTPALVVSTPGAEPVAMGGYSAALLLDAAIMSAGTSLDSGHHALLRWLSAARLVRSGSGGTVLLIGDGAPALSNALVRWDPAGYAERDLTERAELGLPPAVRVGAITGDRSGVDAILRNFDLAPGWRILGPIDVAGQEHDGHQGSLAGRLSDAHVRALVTAPRREGLALAKALRDAATTRAMKREGGTGHIHLDPGELL